jgi:hypothetical protein
MTVELFFGLVMVALVVGLVVLGVVCRGSDGDLLDWRPERLERAHDLAEDTAQLLVITYAHRRQQPDADEPFDSTKSACVGSSTSSTAAVPTPPTARSRARGSGEKGTSNRPQAAKRRPLSATRPRSLGRTGVARPLGDA